jgi:hypothetical protein
MDYRAQLTALANAYRDHTGRSPARVATIILDQSRFFARIADGGGCTVDTYLQVKRWFGDNWPEGAAWPEGVDRPGILPNDNDPPAADAPTRDGTGADDGAGGVSAAGPVQPDQEAA